MTALVIITHQPAASVERMVRAWESLTEPFHVLIAYGGEPEEYQKIRVPKVFIEDPRLRTSDHQRERQSYSGVIRSVIEALPDEGWDCLYLAEYDIEPLVSDLWEKLRNRLEDEDADLLVHRCCRIDDTLHPHYADHLASPEWLMWVKEISLREDPNVVLSGLGCGQFWRRRAIIAVAAAGEPHPAYLELHLPTVAHHLGFRVRGMGAQDRHVSTEELSGARRRESIEDGAWIIHPVKRLWDGKEAVAKGHEAALKVLHLTHFDPPIHGEAMMAGLLRESATKWSDIEYRFINSAYASSREDLSRGSLGKLIKLPWYLGRLIFELLVFRPEVLLLQPAFHPGPFLKDSLFVWLGHFFGARVAAWVHMDPARLELEKRPAWFRWWAEETLERIAPFVACAPALVERWPKWIDSRRRIGIANAISDPNPDGKGAKARCDDDTLHVIFISAMDREKGWFDLFQAARQVCAANEAVDFEFRGGPAGEDNEDSIEQIFADSGFSERIRWRGPAWGAEKLDCLRRADLFVLPSWTEQFPLAVLEAMAFGLPVIATDVGAVSDALSVPQGGELVSPGDSEVLASAICRFLDRPANERRAMGTFNRQRFVAEFTPGSFRQRWHELLHRISASNSTEATPQPKALT